MAEKQIIFSAPMVRAILDGRKTQMRRTMKHQPQPVVVPGLGPMLAINQPHGPNRWLWPNAREEVIASSPFGKPGDRMWVREKWEEANRIDGTPVIAYAAGGCIAVGQEGARGSDVLLRNFTWNDTPHTDCWRPSIQMPRWACRLVLEITDVRVEKLRAISERDAIEEGVGSPITRDCKVPRFAVLWDKLHGDGEWENE